MTDSTMNTHAGIDQSAAGRQTRTNTKTYDIVYVALFAVLIAIFTLQTMGVFLAVGILGGRRGTLSVLVYILLGAIGLPVFAGFTGGVGILLGNTGGYIIGFLFSALVMWGIERLAGGSLAVQAVSMLTGLLVCYAFGTLWFLYLYNKNNDPVSIAVVLGWCVIPFIIPDLIKIALSLVISRRIKKYAVIH